MSSEFPTPDQPASIEAIEAAAAAWLSLRDRGMSSDETAGFVRWLQQDPRHAEVFGELDRTWADFDRLAAVPAAAAAPPDADLLAPRSRIRRTHRLPWRAFAAVAAAAVVLIALLALRGPRHTAETGVGSFRKLDLPDGSIVHLNTNSAIDTHFTATERRVQLARGEVFFAVAKDATRPFVVVVDDIAVRAVGTAFNVRQHADAVEVLVTEGRVHVDDTRSGQSALVAPAAPTPAEPPLLVAGERVVVRLKPPAEMSIKGATIERLAPPAVQRALAWQESRLEFDGVPLAEVASEFNRYNRRQLVIVDPQLGARRFSGTFRADGYESLVRLLETDFGVSASDQGREIVLRLQR